ncbi:DUF3887 domain-containing protein [Candidatus Riflebacteria bacterium]
MKNKIIMGCLGLFVFFCFFVGGCLVLGRIMGGSYQKEYFDALASGEPQKLIAQFDPELIKAVDEPVLKVWMDAVNKHLGVYKGLSLTDFKTSTKVVNGARLTQSEGTVNFEKGTAKSRLTWRSGKLVGFSVNSATLPPDWFKGPASTELYQKIGENFTRLFLEKNFTEAYNLMHPKLQKVVSLEKLKLMQATLEEKFGNFRELKYLSAKNDFSDGQALRIYYDVTFEEGSLTGDIKFQFAGLKGYLLGFNYE